MRPRGVVDGGAKLRTALDSAWWQAAASRPVVPLEEAALLICARAREQHDLFPTLHCLRDAVRSDSDRSSRSATGTVRNIVARPERLIDVPEPHASSAGGLFKVRPLRRASSHPTAALLRGWPSAHRVPRLDPQRSWGVAFAEAARQTEAARSSVISPSPTHL